ncbi:hypothetical protein BK744_08580 [Bacillus thuringiensis serovar zhaodongensis]|nr:binary toxin-like calcium binding domain-containing protein [Bacillus thuringiensis]OUB77819.1 hypothetical protein BK744_08580 [Bacillus thuringiensis serovar zhaodongensis]
MNLKSVFKCFTITAILAQLTVYPAISYAESNNEKNMDMKTTIGEKKGVTGLVGYYFKDVQFTNLSLISFGEQSKLANQTKMKKHNQTFESARWMGRIKASQTGEYTFSTASDQNIILQVNGETIINQGKMEKPLKLEKNKAYELKIEYQNIKDTSPDLQLFWSIEGKEKEKIPEENLLSPNLSERDKLSKDNKDTLFLPDFNLFNNSIVKDLPDSDRDGIPDEWEENGYRVQGYDEIVKWDDVDLAKGYKKYVSNPYSPKTANDPYTDFEKVAGFMPAGTKDEARDPLVAAYPAIGVGMEKFIFSKNDNVTDGQSGSVSKTTSSSTSNSHTVGAGTKLELSTNPFALAKWEMALNYSWTGNWTTGFEETNSQSWSREIQMNTAERAYLNANVRYYNTGTAPIYKIAPTTSLVLRDPKDPLNANKTTTIKTVKATNGLVGESLGPEGTYPSQGLAGLALDRLEDGTRISINAEQLDSIQNNSKKLSLETPQVGGQYGLLRDGGLVINDFQTWAPIQSGIDSTSGALVLDTGNINGNLARKVTAKNENDPNDRTPVITIREAVKKAFNAKEKDGRLYYTDPKGKEIDLDESLITFIFDNNTEQEIKRQLENMQDKKVYNARWKRGMNITIRTPIVSYDFENTNNVGWYGATVVNGGYTGNKHAQIAPNGNGYAKTDLELKPHTPYTVRAYVKPSAANHNVVFYTTNDGKGQEYPTTLNGDQWHVIEYTFNTGAHPENFKKLGLKNEGNAILNVDNVFVQEWGAVLGEDATNLINNGDFSEGLNWWEDHKGEIEDGYFKGSYLKSNQFNIKQNKQYQLTFDSKLDIGSNPGKIYVSFLDSGISNIEINLDNSWNHHSYKITFPTDKNVNLAFISLSPKFNLDNIKFEEVK